MSNFSLEEKFKLITQNLEECLVEEDLRWFLKNNVPLKHYIGFEISGKLHIGSGLMSAIKIRDFQKAGIDCTIFLADWHTWLNDKLSGDLPTIQKIAVNYFKEALKASLLCVGGNPDKVEFILGSNLYHHNDAYWQTVVDVSKNLTLARVVKSSTIMGRKEGENQIFARLIYPPMQVADIFIQGINLCHAGLDQRKAHVIAREVANSLKISPLTFNKKIYKPVALHHHLILGLGKPPFWPIDKRRLREIWSEMKMSKSNPKSCIFIHDTPQEIESKVNDAFCPAKEVSFNPILDWTKHLIFPLKGELFVERLKKFGGNIKYYRYSDLEKDYQEEKIHPQDLKTAVTKSIIEILQPARDLFFQPRQRKMLEELEGIMKTKE